MFRHADAIQYWRNVCHHNKYDMHDAFSLVMECISQSLAVIKYILVTNGLPERSIHIMIMIFSEMKIISGT